MILVSKIFKFTKLVFNLVTFWRNRQNYHVHINWLSIGTEDVFECNSIGITLLTRKSPDPNQNPITRNPCFIGISFTWPNKHAHLYTLKRERDVCLAQFNLSLETIPHLSQFISLIIYGHVSISLPIPPPCFPPPSMCPNHSPTPPLQQNPRAVHRGGPRRRLFIAAGFTWSLGRGHHSRHQEARGRHPQHHSAPRRARLATLPPWVLLLGPAARDLRPWPPCRQYDWRHR